MNLDSTTERIRAYLSGAVATAQPHYLCSWVDHQVASGMKVPGSSQGILDNANPIVVVAAPNTAVQREIEMVSIFNADSGAVTVTIEHYDGADQRTWIKAALAIGGSASWEKGGTWHIYDAAGVLQYVGSWSYWSHGGTGRAYWTDWAYGDCRDDRTSGRYGIGRCCRAYGSDGNCRNYGSDGYWSHGCDGCELGCPWTDWAYRTHWERGSDRSDFGCRWSHGSDWSYR